MSGVYIGLNRINNKVEYHCLGCSQKLSSQKSNAGVNSLYFSKFIDAYKAQGIQIGMVMPQNEFNSDQVFPSCTWKASSLANFVSYLGPEMQKNNVDVFFGTMERPNYG